MIICPALHCTRNAEATVRRKSVCSVDLERDPVPKTHFELGRLDWVASQAASSNFPYLEALAIFDDASSKGYTVLARQSQRHQDCQQISAAGHDHCQFIAAREVVKTSRQDREG